MSIETALKINLVAMVVNVLSFGINLYAAFHNLAKGDVGWAVFQFAFAAVAVFAFMLCLSWRLGQQREMSND